VSDTPLGQKLKRLIEANGPLSIADYMAHCMSDPEHGYYTTRDPFGARGDFVTAPEISQMFGEIVAAWLIETRRLVGAPSPVRLIELGPGRGTLMADILRVAAKAPDFSDAIKVHLVETSPALKYRQAETLASFQRDIKWHASFSEVPEGPLLLVANEFFDALPIRQYVRVDGAWRERVVGLDVGGQLTLGIGVGTLDNADPLILRPGSDKVGTASKETPENTGDTALRASRLRSAEHLSMREVESTPAATDLPIGRRLSGSGTEGDFLELRPAADALMAEIARRIVEHGGAALIIDYGHDAPPFGDTLQAVRGHKYADPLDSPGEADLTAHVDFGALARTARAWGASVHGPMNQGDFLVSLGLLERAGRLGRNADAATREALRVAVERLAGAGQMGRLFKVAAIARPSIRLAVFEATSK
jgi:NADH dehydrogenase [ubiquinone] 1 alpha subcomplex assembly factor 7